MDTEARPGHTESVLRTQRKLQQWAKQGEAIQDAWGWVTSDAFLLEAWTRLSRNKGSNTAGIDGVTRRDVERRGVGAFLSEVKADLKAGTYQPLPVREHVIPKSGGRVRRLGIPALRDRLVQMALKMVLEPVFEEAFYDCSFGFRPGRSCHDALVEVRRFGNRPRNYVYVIEADIESCFENVDHRLLMQTVSRRVSDRKVLQLIWLFLRAGVLRDGWAMKSDAGVPQGGVLSPLLANVYLTALDAWYDERFHSLTDWQRSKLRRAGQPVCWLIRYADDFCVMVCGTREQAEAERQRLAAFLELRLRMKLSPEKTRVTHLTSGIEFLGFTVRLAERRSGGLAVTGYPSRKAVRSLMRRIREWTSRSTCYLPLSAVLAQVNRLLRGWAAYFRYGASSRVFSYLAWYAWHCVRRWLKRKHPHRPWAWIIRRFRRGPVWAEGKVELFRIDKVSATRWKARTRKRPLPWSQAGETLG